MKKHIISPLFFLLISISTLSYYRTPWKGALSDQAVQKSGYTYYLCNKKCNTDCFAIYLTPQEIFNTIEVLKPYYSESLDDAIEHLKMESTDKPRLAIKIVHDFKEFRSFCTIAQILEILENTQICP